MNCWVNKTLIVWIISPLNALANQQVRTFTKWNIRAVAVNSTTTYSGIYKDILAGKYQVVISSIEAFTDTTRLLPIIQSEELARQRKHVAIMDEAHCIVKWGKLFRPRYAVAGDMRLVLPGHTPYVAATATANQATREGIKHVLRLSDDLLPVHLGNHRENLAYSVHRLKKGKSSISELLGYYPDKTRRLPRFSLIFVDNRPLGQLALSLLRQDMLPQLRYKAQIYHAFRSDNVKEILAAGFETEDGFSDLVCTESLTMGIDFRRVGLLIQLFAPEDAETLAQRGGRAGRDKSVQADVVVMIQNSLFNDSREGQKRLLKAAKKEQESLPGPSSQKSGKTALETPSKQANSHSKAKRSPREYSQAIIDFVNTTGCRIKVLDEEFGNPARLNDTPCLCDNCKHSRGEPTIQDRIQKRSNKRRQPDNEASVIQDEVESQFEQLDNNAEMRDGDSVTEDDTSDVDNCTGSKNIRWRPTAKRQPYVDALKQWRSNKYNSPECEDWNGDEEWVLSSKILNLIARDPRITGIESLALLQPRWTHTRRWGAEIATVLAEVSDQQQLAEDNKQRVLQAKQAARDAARAEYIQNADRNNAARQLSAPEASASTRPAKRARISANATAEEKALHTEVKKAQKRQYDRERYQRRKNQQKTNPKGPEYESRKELPVQGPVSASQPIPDTTPIAQAFKIVTFEAKQELLESQIAFSDPQSDSATASHLVHSPSSPGLFCSLPNAPGPSTLFRFENTAPEAIQQSIQPTSQLLQQDFEDKTNNSETSTQSKPKIQSQPLPN
ncbi:hypothetical protein FRC09_019993 [Ceratobasidium sp. 395]|nr:hypothetical protein FRC09_019993 [Ceratobasidium sp. 395]